MNEVAPHAETLKAQNDIVVGHAVIPSLPSRKTPVTWVLPNFQYTTDREYALECANRIHQLIESNWHKRKKK